MVLPTECPHNVRFWQGFAGLSKSLLFPGAGVALVTNDWCTNMVYLSYLVL